MRLLLIFALLAIGLANLNDAKTIEQAPEAPEAPEALTTKSPVGNVLEVARQLGCARFYNLANTSSTRNILVKESPFTLFAPSDLAVRSFDDAELARIMADPALLHSFIGFHAGFGSVMAKDITNDKELISLAGYKIRMNVYTVNEIMSVTASGAPVSNADNPASNGVVHVVDAILYPPPRETIQETLRVGQEFGLISAFVTRANFTYMFQEGGPFTFFAPTDVAIEKLLPDEIIILVENPPILDYFMRLHTVKGTFHTPGLINNTLTSLNNRPIRTEVNKGGGSAPAGIFVNGAQINRASQYPTTNGVIHGVDSVLADPQTLRAMAEKRNQHRSLASNVIH